MFVDVLFNFDWLIISHVLKLATSDKLPFRAGSQRMRVKWELTQNRGGTEHAVITC